MTMSTKMINKLILIMTTNWSPKEFKDRMEIMLYLCKFKLILQLWSQSIVIHRNILQIDCRKRVF
jgi:hypothetical protein